MVELPPGTRVRMTRKFRKMLRWMHRKHGGHSHAREFGRLVGVVEGLVDWNSTASGHPNYDLGLLGPEVNVRWFPKGSTNGLRYMYDPEDLEVVRG